MDIEYIDGEMQNEPFQITIAEDDSLESFLDTMQVHQQKPRSGSAMILDTNSGATSKKPVTWYGHIGVIAKT